MRQLPPRKLNPIAAGAMAASIDAGFDAQLREANLKMPIKDAMRDLAHQMQAHLDAELQKAVERFLGMPLSDPQIVRGRLHHVHQQGEACTIYSLDGVPVLRAGQQVLERRGEAIHAFQLVEQLLPEDFKPTSRIIAVG